MNTKGKIGPKKIIGKMELRDAIHAVDADYPGTIFYVGSESSFFFIGTAEEFDNDIEGINKEYRELFRIAKNRISEELKDTLKNLISNNSYDEEFTEKIYYRKEDLTRTIAKTSKYYDAYHNWRDIQHRTVKKCYKKDPISEFDVPNGLIMIVPGYEQGKWSFSREYKRKTVQSDTSCSWYDDDKEDNE